MANENVQRRRTKLISGQDNDENNGDYSLDYKPKSSGRDKPSTSLWKIFSIIFRIMLLSGFILIFIGLYSGLGIDNLTDQVAIKLGYEKKQYAVIIDAGSTGSRVLAYEFHYGYLDNRLILDKSLFEEKKPGLSFYADRPADGAKSIEVLLDIAKNVIPNDKWKSTPLVLRATAGLRLLDPAKADNLLNSVRELFYNSGFLVFKDAVEIMDGTDEGILSWFTINFLLNKLHGNTIAALDLGGGSTQVTYEPDASIRTPLYSKYIHTVNSSHDSIDVFTNSYLGLGLMAVRHAVFTDGLPKDQTIMDSECVNAIVRNNRWTYSTVEYQVSGKPAGTKENPIVDINLCQKKIRKVITPLLKPKPIKLSDHPIAAFSYYFERAAETGLIEPFKGGIISIADFKKQAKATCSNPNTDQPFMCLDILYISMLLEEGFDLRENTKIELHKKVNGHEISWALGLAYNVLMSLS